MKKYIGMFLVLIMLVTMLSACSGKYTPTPTKEPAVFEQQSKQNEENVKDLISKKDLPKLENSQDFDNVSRRLEYLNQKNNVGYLYVFSSTGVLLREVQVMGKTTSLKTYITPMEEIKKVQDYKYLSNGGVDPTVYVAVQAPDLDGTYGENADGVFWFTPDGVYQELIGEGFICYFSAERMSFVTQPILVEVNK